MCVCVWSPQANVIHSRDGVLSLCHVEVSGRSFFDISVLLKVKQQCIDFYYIPVQ